LAFDTQVDDEIGFLGDIPHERRGLVRSEIIDTEMPLHNPGISFNGGPNMGQGNRIKKYKRRQW
jgi:hypothetical protein